MLKETPPNPFSIRLMTRRLDAVVLLGLPLISQEGIDRETIILSAKQMASNFRQLNDRRNQLERRIVTHRRGTAKRL